MREWRYNEAEESGQLILSGDLTIDEITVIREQVLEAFARTDRLAIDISAVARFDIAGLQLLCACHRYAGAHGRTIQLQTGSNQALRDIVRQIGMERNFGCDPQRGPDCFWTLTETTGH
ncbi:MAG: STAS domain-containing protein [Desulfuromonadales bacterium]|nr:STAS domain-containing protein [Desulfuromonadales bacterium]